MKSLFRKKQTVHALAEVLEDGREITTQELSKRKYNQYRGKVPILEVAVRVQPDTEPMFEAKIKVENLQTYLLMPGVHVQVKYDLGKNPKVVMDDTDQAILARNPQLIKNDD